MRVVFSVLAILCIFGLAAHGQKAKSKSHIVWTPFYNGETFLGLSDHERMMYATGLTDGFIGSGLFDASDESVAGLVSCVKGMSNNQITAIFTKYVNDHPENWHYPMSIQAFNALDAACPGKLKTASQRE
jgi:hypothetical protein